MMWNTTYNSSSGQTSTFSVSPPVTGGSGHIFNVANVNLANLPPSIQQQLIQAGAQGVSTAPYIDTNTPMTAAFLSGQQGTNGWYTGPVNVMLIATDIDGPSDIAATSYKLDGGSTRTYTGPFPVSGNGTHTIVFGSVDQALNVEIPKSQSFMIDAKPPAAVPTISGTAGNNGWYTSNVLVTWSATDSVSGISSSTGCAPTNLTAETAGVTLTCSATNGAGLQTSVSVTVRVDKTPPAISGMPASGCSVWPPNGKMAQVAAVNAADTLSGLAPNSFQISGASNEPPSASEISIAPSGTGGYIVQLQADRFGTGTGRIYALTATATDLAGNTATLKAICTVPHDQGK
jgi:hypothetical protein